MAKFILTKHVGGSLLILIGILANKPLVEYMLLQYGTFRDDQLLQIGISITSIQLQLIIFGIILLFFNRSKTYLSRSETVVTYALGLMVMFLVVLFPIVEGINRPYWAHFDMDFKAVVNSLYFLSNREPTFQGHAGFLYYILNGAWIKALSVLGFIQFSDLDQFLRSISVRGFGLTVQEITVPARVLSIVIGLTFIVSFIVGTYLYTKDRLISVAMGLFLATTQGFLGHITKIRLELLSAWFFMIAIFIVLLSPRINEKYRGLVYIALGVVCMLSLMAKSQTIYGIVTIPILMVAVNRFNLIDGTLTKTTNSLKVSWTILVVPALASIPLIYDIIVTLDGGTLFYGVYGKEYRLIAPWLYYVVIGYFLGAWAITAQLNKDWEAVTKITILVLSGCGIAYLLHYLWFDKRFLHSVILFVDFHQTYTLRRVNTGYVGGGFTLTELVQHFRDAGLDILLAKLLVFSPRQFLDDRDPFSVVRALLLLVVLGGLIYRKTRRINYLPAVFLGLALFLEMVFRLRNIAKHGIGSVGGVLIDYQVWYDFLYLICLVVLLKGWMVVQKGHYQNDRVSRCKFSSSSVRFVVFLLMLSFGAHNLAMSALRVHREMIPFQMMAVKNIPEFLSRIPAVSHFVHEDSKFVCKPETAEYNETACFRYFRSGL